MDAPLVNVLEETLIYLTHSYQYAAPNKRNKRVVCKIYMMIFQLCLSVRLSV